MVKLLKRLFETKAQREARIRDERRWKIQAILNPLVTMKIIDTKNTLSKIVEISINMGDPKLKLSAIKMIAGIMNKLVPSSRQEFYLSIGLALGSAYSMDYAKELTEEIFKEYTHLVNKN